MRNFPILVTSPTIQNCKFFRHRMFFKFNFTQENAWILTNYSTYIEKKITFTSNAWISTKTMCSSDGQYPGEMAERVQPAPIYLRYIRIPFQINCRASAERVQLGPIYLRYISLASQSFLLPCLSCWGWSWNDSWILFWSLTWISVEESKSER